MTKASNVAKTVIVIGSLINLKQVFIDEIEEKLDEPNLDPTMRSAYMCMLTMANCDLEHLEMMKHYLMPRRPTPFRLRFPQWFKQVT